MPAPTRAPERPSMTPPPQEPRFGRPMSDQRRYRLRRTIAFLTVIGLVALVVKLAGSDAPAVATSGAISTARVSPEATAAASPRASSSASGATPGQPTASARSEPTSVPDSASGTLTAVAIPGSDTDRAGRKVTFSVQVENGLGVDSAAFAADVRSILSDARGWEPEDHIRFVAVSPAQLAAGESVEIKLTLASPQLTDQLCAPLQTLGEVSCDHNGRAVINARRWVEGVKYYKDLDLYRVYVINHEVGHSLWHPHQNCPSPGARAPIMVQQTLGLQGCIAWPYPQGA